jgi:dolichol-phosphate mannosyltransferase
MPALVVVPTYDERDTIEQTVTQLLDRPAAPDVLVVDDNSPDGTRDVVTKLIDTSHDRVSLLARPGKLGLGRAYTAAFRYALELEIYDVIVQMDADGSHSPAEIDVLIDTVKAGADLAIGSRYVAGGDAPGLDWRRGLLSRGGNEYARLLTRISVKDLTGGFKAWRADLLRTVLERAPDSDGYTFQVEMTLRAARAGADIREVPITFHERRAGQSKLDWRIAAEAVWRVPRLALH